MKELKIDGIILIPDDMSLQEFAEKFNDVLDKGKICFSGGIKEIEKEILRCLIWQSRML